MRYVFVNHRYYPFIGGSERYVQELAEDLAVQRHDVSVVTTDAHDLEYFWDKRRRSIDAPSTEIHRGVHINRLALRHLPANEFIFPAARRLMGEMSRVVGAAAPFNALARRLPAIPHLNDHLRRLSPADVYHGTNLGLEGPAVNMSEHARASGGAFVLTPFIHLGVPGDPIARRYVSMPHQVDLLRRADLVIAMTELERRFIIAFGVDERKVAVSGVGVTLAEVQGGDGDRFRQKHGIRGYMLAAIGAMATDKGTLDTVRAVIDLRRAGVDVELALAGPALSQFERWFDGIDKQDREGIHVLGFISPEEKRDLLVAMDALVMPSRTESFGIVYLEAWANRKPVVAAEAGAVTELVKNGENGLLVPFGAPREIADRVRTLMQNPSLASELGDAGFAVTADRYTWRAVLGRLRDAHEQVLGVRIAEC